MHAAAPILPAAFAVAEREHADGRALLRAAVLGYEAGLRVGEAVNPSHYTFWHPTGTAATFGAAVAAGALLGLDRDADARRARQRRARKRPDCGSSTRTAR